VRDAVAAEAHGLPVLLLVTRGVATLARETARVNGLPNLNVLAVDRGLVGLSRAEIAEAAGALEGTIVGALVDTAQRPDDEQTEPTEVT
jgi:hypothetical protein